MIEIRKTDTTDNILADEWVILAMAGDITGPEGKVDMKDIQKVLKLFGVNYPDPRYNPNYDVIYDLKIDFNDTRAVTKHSEKSTHKTHSFPILGQTAPAKTPKCPGCWIIRHGNLKANEKV